MTERRKQAYQEFYAVTMGSSAQYVLERIVREGVNTDFLSDSYPASGRDHKWHIKIEITEV